MGTDITESFDLIIIGSGSGNSLVTPYWDGRRVAIIDAGVFGGTCLNVGCIPTKMFAYPASLAAVPAESGRLGVDLELGSTDWAGIRDRIFSRIDAISAGGFRYRDQELDHTTVITEESRFTGTHQLTTASGRVLESETIVVAAGSRPVRPDVPGIDLPQVHTSDSIMRLPTLPETLVVLGGGFIAAEFAAVFSGLGSSVVQVNRSSQLLRTHDETISERFTELASRQWRLETGWTLSRIVEAESGWVAVHLEGAEGATMVIDAEAVLVAQGRTPNTDRLDPASAGLDVHGDGRLVVDEYQRLLSGGTPVPGLWALGDISSEHQLKHVANHDQRIVSHNLEHPDDLRANTLGPVPSAVFTRPQIGSAGLTEAQAVAEYGRDRISVKVQQYGDVAYGWAMEDTSGLCKLIADRQTGQLIGAHLIGHEAPNLIQLLVQAMSFGVDAHALARGQYWIHPALSEVVENALLGLEVPDSGLV
ncbi:pyridine nucleotide-disulphide oxidoreductase family protein [Citricoccus zhacaiensis]|uniref:Pyridine nucleotide-disulphide oxidoreductase family protein n=1 Tax=Citricoccus zhacaiensis TaxID=489142 RepID=A0ABQ2M840_9MICC|nr:mycothione reductase [Citricoccus zhacaiensis]GGO47013.1 pyridine nucleotide-disulphide oxidoreductase family protein [Citricoccus zhacaiensis]